LPLSLPKTDVWLQSLRKIIRLQELRSFVNNPLCPANPESFWSTTLDKGNSGQPALAKELVERSKELYKHWNLNYCKGQGITKCRVAG